MSKVIFFSYPYHGHINPTLSLVTELVARGETVIYYATEPFRTKIEATGALFRCYPDFDKIENQSNARIGPDNQRLLPPPDGITYLVQMAASLLQQSRFIEQRITSEIIAENPDYIIHDSYAYWGKEIARKLEVPAVSSVSNAAICDEMVDMAPEFIIGKVLQMADSSFFARYKPAILRRMVDLASVSLSQTFGIPDFNFINTFTGKEGLNLVYTSNEFQPFHALFDLSYLFIGPSIQTRHETTDFPRDLLCGTPVYISLGTVFNHSLSFFKKCLAAFGDDDRQYIMSVGHQVSPEELTPVPENFLVREYVPQLEVLQQAGLFITHGGTNSINEALYYHVPMVVFPQAVDQYLGAEMVEMAGAGVYLRNREFTVEELRETVAKVWSDSSYLANCKKIGESFKNAGGVKRGVDEIFKYKVKSGIKE